MALTPMMQQYLQVKEKCKDCILFFRLGDFYEMFFEDAQVASKELELVLTGRDCGLEDRAPMCGIPYHAANTYIGRLINRGYKIAICEQMEDPALAKGIVKRDIIKIITPGTYSDPSFLEDNKNNYLMSVFLDSRRNMVGICTADISTGDFSVTNIFKDYSIILDEISKFSPKEIIIQEDLDDKLIEHIKDRFFISLTIRNNDYFIKDSDKNINEKFSINQGDFDDTIICASNGLLNYIFETQKIVLSNINRLEFYNIIDYLTIDANSRRNLELTETLRDKTKKGSLLWVIDKTNTAMGARQLRRWIDQPLMKKSMIQERLDSIEELVQDLNLHEDIKEILKEIYDIERIVGKVCSKSVNAKELISLKNSIEKLPRIKSLLKDSRSNLLRNIYNEIDELNDIHEVIDRAVQDNPSLSVKEGNIIKNGYNIEVDELRNAKSHGKEWIAALENNEKEVTGIKSLKVGYNKVFGYYIEITNANLNLVPEGRYIRKQTLSNAERYITPELKDMEEKILGAEDRLTILEYELFVEIRDKIERQIDRMQKSAHLVAFLDCLSSLATVALENNYCKPEITDDGKIEIEEGRHPVVEKVISNGSFIANNTNIDNNEEQLLLITGPNMAGKSTYMRQVALIVILAQLGSFVPATKATICICDKIFTRIGASDDLSAGKSTFMVEMWEVSNILRNITCRSLILLDEVGRGTSTYDGLSIAWSVIEYICSNPSVKCKTLFATHYHELTKLEGQVNGVKNYSVAVKEIGADIVFLRKIVKGGADQSYGIQVAKLAGLPDEVINRAKEILKGLEKNKYDESKVNKKSSAIKEAAVTKNDAVQIGFGDIKKDNLIRNIANIDFMNITPMDGFNKLYEIIKKAKELC